MNASPINQKRILVVDDEEYIRALLKQILEGAGYGVVTAANGHEAMDKLADTGINLVLLDIKMPGLNGFQTLELIRKQFNLPIIMVTGVGETTTAASAIDLGADDYIRKPFNHGELLARVKAKLKRMEK